MDLIRYVSLLQLFLGMVTECLALKKLFGYRLKNGKWRNFSVPFVVLVQAVGVMLLDSEVADLLTEIVVAASFAVIPYVLFEKKKNTSFFLFGLTFCAVLDFVVFCIAFVFTSLTPLVSSMVYCGLYVICILLTTIACKMRKNSVPEGFLEQLPTLVYVGIYVAALATFYSITENSDPTYFSDVGNTLMIVSVFLVVGCIAFVFARYSSLSQKQKETENMLNLQLKHYEDMVSKNRDIREFRHDYKNNLISIHSFLSSGKTDEALKYIETLSSGLSATQSMFSTGNYLADVILSDKAMSAKNLGIDVEFSGSVPQYGISNNDLCTVFTNILDNAIRGCDGVENAKITVKGTENPNGFVLEISNPVTKVVEIKNNKVKTSKADKENHGFGIELVKKTAKSYNGYVQLSCENSVFKIEVGFILKGEV